MKKLLILFCLALTVTLNYSQDSLDVGGLTTLNTLPDNAKVWFWNISGVDTNDYNVDGDYIQPLLRNGSTLYPRSSGFNLNLGSSGTTTYKLNVEGASRFTNNTLFESSLRIGLTSNYSSIYYSGNNLTFSDPNAGTKTLSELISEGGTTYTYGNGTEEYGDNLVRLGGTISENIQIGIDDYDFRIGEVGSLGNSRSYVKLSRNSFTDLVGVSGLRLYGYPLTLFSGVDGGDGHWSMTSSSSGNVFRDYHTSIPTGLSYYAWSTYWTNIQSENKQSALVSYGMVQEMVSEGSGGVETPGILDDQTSAYVKLFKAGTDSFQLQEVQIDTLTTNSYSVTVSYTAANVNNGDEIAVLSSPGSGRCYIPTHLAIQKDAGSSAFTGTGNSFVKVGSSSILSVPYNVFATALKSNYTYYNSSSGHNSNLDSAMTFEFSSTFAAGDSGGKIIIYYYIADFN